MCRGRCQDPNGPCCAGLGTLLPCICCWPQLGQDTGWFLWSSLPSLGTVGTASLSAAASGAVGTTKAFELCPLLFLLVLCSPAPAPSQSKSGVSVHIGAMKRKVFAKADTATVPPLRDYWWTLCSQHGLSISRSCHFLSWDRLAEVFCQYISGAPQGMPDTANCSLAAASTLSNNRQLHFAPCYRDTEVSSSSRDVSVLKLRPHMKKEQTGDAVLLFALPT